MIATFLGVVGGGSAFAQWERLDAQADRGRGGVRGRRRLGGRVRAGRRGGGGGGRGGGPGGGRRRRREPRRGWEPGRWREPPGRWGGRDQGCRPERPGGRRGGGERQQQPV